MPPPHAPRTGPASPAGPVSSSATSAPMQQSHAPEGLRAPAAAQRQLAGGSTLRQAVLIKEALAATRAGGAAPTGRSQLSSPPLQAAAGFSPSKSIHSPSQDSSHTHLLAEGGASGASPLAGSSPSSRHAVSVVRSGPVSPAAAAPAAEAAARGAAVGGPAPAAAAPPGEVERQAPGQTLRTGRRLTGRPRKSEVSVFFFVFFLSQGLVGPNHVCLRICVLSRLRGAGHSRCRDRHPGQAGWAR